MERCIEIDNSDQEVESRKKERQEMEEGQKILMKF